MITEDTDLHGAVYEAVPSLSAPVFDVQNGATLQNVTVIGNEVGYGVQVSGDGGQLDNVTVRGGLYGIHVVGCNAVTLNRCQVEGAKLFGINLEHTDGTQVINCTGIQCGLDGVKLRAKATNITVAGGRYAENGQDPDWAGDGIDCYAGGNGVLLDSVIFENNLGNGITIKTDVLNRDEPGTYGMVGNITMRDCISRGNTGSGATLIAFDETMPLPEGFTIERGAFVNNGLYGLLIQAGQVTVLDADCRNDGAYDDIRISNRSEDVTLTNVLGAVYDARLP